MLTFHNRVRALRPVANQPGRSPETVDDSSLDTLDCYFRDVGNHRLLSHDEEIELARAVRAAQEVRRRLDAGEEVPGASQILAAGDSAREALVYHNLRLVVSIARKYRTSGLPLADLIQEGNLGLMTAVERYDPELGYRFSTYATFWIRQAIGRAVANLSRTIRVPVHIHELIWKVRRVEAELEQRLGRQPTEAEVAESAGIELERVQQARQASVWFASLDEPVSEDGETTLGATIPHPASETVVDDAVYGDLQRHVEMLLSRLPDRERTIVAMRFGLEGWTPQTLQEVAMHYGISRERVRQIEKDALSRLRRSGLVVLGDVA